VELFEREPDDFWLRSLSISVIGHVAIGIFMIVNQLGSFGDMPEPVVYSVSIEGGTVIGGKSQVAKDDKKSPLAPVKNVAAQSDPEQQLEKPETKQPEKEQPPVDDAEVSVAEKKPTPAPKVTPVKTTAPKQKATPVPPKKTDKKSDGKTKRKSDGDEVDKQYQVAMQRYLGESSDAGGKGFGAAKVGGKGMGGGEVRPPEFFAYKALVMSRIKSAWRWYDTNTALITVVTFNIQPNGEIRRVQVEKSSGDDSFDESVHRAVVKASPLPPPPETVYQYFESLRITFDPRDW
jgi:TonB family protein